MSVALSCLWTAQAFAADVGLAGTFPGKALLTINGGPPRIVPVGERTAEGVKVLSVDGETATFETEGRRQVLRVGQNVVIQPVVAGSPTVVMTADAAGHFMTNGSINGASVRFIVDTGATTISIGASDARRIGIDATKGSLGYAQTANGVTPVVHVRLNAVRVGEIVLNNIEATIYPNDMPAVLLGMSFLNRMEMQRHGDIMTLKQNY